MTDYTAPRPTGRADALVALSALDAAAAVRAGAQLQYAAAVRDTVAGLYTLGYDVTDAPDLSLLADVAQAADHDGADSDADVADVWVAAAQWLLRGTDLRRDV